MESLPDIKSLPVELVQIILQDTLFVNMLVCKQWHQLITNFSNYILYRNLAIMLQNKVQHNDPNLETILNNYNKKRLVLYKDLIKSTKFHSRTTVSADSISLYFLHRKGRGGINFIIGNKVCAIRISNAIDNTILTKLISKNPTYKGIIHTLKDMGISGKFLRDLRAIVPYIIEIFDIEKHQRLTL